MSDESELIETSLQKWIASASAWIADQGDHGDWSRRAVLDPALETMLPDVSGKQVLDLGCGEGRYCRVLKTKGACVTGIDPVPQFIEHARGFDAESTYLEAIAEDLPFPPNSFDLVLSYLTFVDIPDLEKASKEVVRVLKPSGQLIVVSISNVASTTDSWVKDEQGRKSYRTVDRYMEHFALELEWRNIRIRNYHRPLSYVLGLFFAQGLVLDQFVEPLPAPDDRNYKDEFRVPTFQIYSMRGREQG